jgi:hypothetical protein
MVLNEKLETVINEWEMNGYVEGSNTYKAEPSPLCEGELMITFYIKLDVNYYNRQNTISVRRRFFTFAQNNPKIGTDGDVYRLRNLLKVMEAEFQQKIDDIVSY